MTKIILFFIILSSSFTGFASHLMGGEITWECLGNGSFKFYMKLYRDCNGIDEQFTFIFLDVKNHPTITNIQMTQIARNDISPQCPGGVSVTCTGGGNGAVEELIFVSSPITLSGVPPAAGWIFSYSNCCRNSAISNLVNPGGQGFTLRAKMFNLQGQNTAQCYDSSPNFSERPSTIVCAGSSFSYNHNAYDPDLDSLVFSFGQPLDSYSGTYSENPLLFSTGYSQNSPLPSTAQIANNVGATINSSTGEISFTSYTQGNFVICIKVASYRCGVLISEVYRELQILVIPCGTNNKPEITPPFQDLSGSYTLFADTVIAGELVNFQYFVNDDINQQITISASGSQFGTNFANPNNGCSNPPCAILGPPPLPFLQGQDSVGFYFQWQTSCDHLSTNGLCASTSNTYNFIFTAKDNFCPTPGTTIGTVSITVLSPPPIEPPELKCIATDANNGATITWTQPIDTNTSFYSYQVFASDQFNGNYIMIDEVQDYNQLSYYHNSSGTNSDTIYYFIQTTSGCNGAFTSPSSDTLAAIFLQDSIINNIGLELYWNAMSSPILSSTNGYYQIYKELNGNFVLLDSTLSLSYIDTNVLCNEASSYLIRYEDATGCISQSNIKVDSLSFNTIFPTIENGNLCINDSIEVYIDSVFTNTYSAFGWINPSGDSIIADTLSFQASNSEWHNFEFFATNSKNCEFSIIDSVFVQPLPIIETTVDTAICHDQLLQLIAQSTDSLYWNANPAIMDTNADTVNLSLANSENFIVNAINEFGCVKSDTIEVEVFSPPIYSIIGDTVLCKNDSLNIQLDGAIVSTWLTNNTVISDTVTNELNVLPIQSEIFKFNVSDTNNCTFSDSVQIVVNALPFVDAGTDTSFCYGSSIQSDASTNALNPEYAWWPNLVSDSTMLHPHFSNLTDTTFILQVTDENGCVNIDSVNILTNALPTVSVRTDTSICFNDSIILVASSPNNVSYQWSGLNMNTIGINGDSVYVNPTTTTTYYMEVTDALGCLATDSVLITINPLPDTTFLYDSLVCWGSELSLTFNSFDALNWNNQPYIDASDPLIPIFSNTLSTYFPLEITNSFNCKIIDSIQIIVSTLPSLVMPQDTSICYGDSIPVVVNSNGVINWSSQAFLSDSLSSNPLVYPQNSQMFYATATNNDNCSVMDSIEIQVNELPLIEISGPTENCVNETTSWSTMPIVDVLWYFQDTLVSSIVSSNFTETNIVDGNYTITAVYTDLNMCANADTLHFITHPLPSFDAGNDSWVCPGSTFTIGDTTSQDLSFNWSPALILQDATVSNPSGSIEDTVEFTLTYTDLNSCTNFDTVVVYSNANVPTNAGPTKTICLGDTIAIGGNPTSPNGTSFSWDGDNLVNPTDANPLAFPTITQEFIVYATNDTCSGVDTATIVVNTLPTIILSADSLICFNDSTIVNISGGINYTWPIGNDITIINDSTVYYFPTSSDSIIAFGEDANGCINADTSTVVVQELPELVLIAGNDICIGDSVLISVTGGLNYEWSNVPTVNEHDSLFWYIVDQNNSLQVTATDYFQCASDTSFNITPIQLPSISILGPDSVCIGDNNIFVGEGTATFVWYIDNSMFATTDTVNYVANNTFDLTLIGTSTDGCRDTVLTTVNTNEYINPIIEIDSSFNCDGKLFEFTNMENYGENQWVSPSNEGIENTFNYLIKYNETSVITNTFNNNGCITNSSFNLSNGDIMEYFEMILPNVFTPNDDGNNDVYTLAIPDEFKMCPTITIYNRWGQMVYNNNVPLGWDGKIKGKDAPEGVYFVTVEMNENSFTTSLQLNR